MKIGQVVNFYRPVENVRKDAEVVEIDDEKDATAKILTLTFTEDGQEFKVTGVRHLRDAPEGAPFWLVKGERAPAGWADAEVSEDVELPVVEPVVELEEEHPRRKRR